MTEQETGFSVDGRIYPVPAIDTFTFDELETLYRYCGITISDWGRRFTPEGAEAWDKSVNHPGFQMALVHVAYRRGNPGIADDTVRDLVRDLVWMDVVEPLIRVEQEPDPLASELTSEPDEPSGSLPSDKPSLTEPEKPSSGKSSPDGSETDASPDEPTGTTGLGTSATAPPLKRVV